MRANGRVLAVVAVIGLLAGACGDDGGGGALATTPTARAATTTTAPTTTAPEDPSAALFDPAVLHEVTMDLSEDALGFLAAQTWPYSEDRVPVRLTVDGVTLDDAGVRLKGGFAQSQAMDGKPGFSIKTDELVDGQDLSGVTRFTFGNSWWDDSFVAEDLVYEVYRAVGIPVARAALARVTVNGEAFGLYVMRESYDQHFLARHFADPDGNLYESPGDVDVLDTDLELRTNEEAADTRDLQAIADVVASTPADQYRAAIEELVDVDELLTYWAVEALTAHWDGYLYDVTQAGREGNPWANNYYAYHDPDSGRFIVIPAGADLAFGIGMPPGPLDAQVPVLLPPKPNASIAMRLWEDPGFRGELAARLATVLDEVWDEAALVARADLFAELVRADGLTGTREDTTMADFEQALAERKAWIAQRGPAVQAELQAATGG
jgi:spore coat protein CotH